MTTQTVPAKGNDSKVTLENLQDTLCRLCALANGGRVMTKEMASVDSPLVECLDATLERIHDHAEDILLLLPW
jgi:hypothetical protein